MSRLLDRVNALYDQIVNSHSVLFEVFDSEAYTYVDFVNKLETKYAEIKNPHVILVKL